MKESEDVTVRVNFRPHQDIVAPVEHSLHWGRITACLLALTLIIAVIVMVYQYYVQEDTVAVPSDLPYLTNQAEITTRSTADETVLATDQLIGLENTVNQTSLVERDSSKDNASNKITATENSINKAVDKETGVNESSITDTLITPQNNEPSNANTLVELITNNEVEIATSTLDANENTSSLNTDSANLDDEQLPTLVDNKIELQTASLNDSHSTETLSKNQPQSIQSAAHEHSALPEHITTPPSTLLTQGKVERLSDNINRFQITPFVEDNEPVGSIDDIEAENGMLTVYAFSEVSNLKGNNLYYVWNLNGNDVATVTIAIGGNRWRSHSTKFIEPSMQGQWKVTLQNSQGDVLAINEFVY